MAETTIFGLWYPELDDIADNVTFQEHTEVLEATLEGITSAICNAAGHALLSGGLCTVGTGLSVELAELKLFIERIYCELAAPATVSGLEANAVNYIYAVRGAIPNPTKALTLESNTTGTPPTGGALISTATTDGDSVTAVDNNPAGRPPSVDATVPVAVEIELTAGVASYDLGLTPSQICAVFYNGGRLRASEFSVVGSDITFADSRVPLEGSAGDYAIVECRV